MILAQNSAFTNQHNEITICYKNNTIKTELKILKYMTII